MVRRQWRTKLRHQGLMLGLGFGTLGCANRDLGVVVRDGNDVREGGDVGEGGGGTGGVGSGGMVRSSFVVMD